MKKILIYIVLILIVLGTLYYLLDLQGLFAGLFGGGLAANQVLKGKADQLKKDQEDIEKQLEVLEQELDKKPEDLTPEEEKDYWKNQDV